MNRPNQTHIKRQVRKEVLRMRAAEQRQALCRLGCDLMDQAHPQHMVGRVLGLGTRSMRTFKWGRALWSLHRRYELLFSSAWLLFRGMRGRSLRWPTLGLVALRLLRFSLERETPAQASKASSSGPEPQANYAQPLGEQAFSAATDDTLAAAPAAAKDHADTTAQLAALQSRLETAEAQVAADTLGPAGAHGRRRRRQGRHD